MPTTLDAIYENGVLKPVSSAGLKEHHKYRVTLEESEQADSGVKFTQPHPVLGNIVFHENPETPLDQEDWPDPAE